MKNVIACLILASSVLLPFGSAAAQTRDEDGRSREVLIINDASEPVFWLYGSSGSTSDWEEDILGTKVIMPGSAVRVDFWDGTNACVFDVKVIWRSERQEIAWGVDVCSGLELTFGSGAPPASADTTIRRRS